MLNLFKNRVSIHLKKIKVLYIFIEINDFFIETILSYYM